MDSATLSASVEQAVGAETFSRRAGTAALQGAYLPAGAIGPEPAILLSKRLTSWKRRDVFTHELGHHLDDQDAPELCNASVLEPKFKTRGNAHVAWNWRRTENRADRIKQAILMPTQPFIKDARMSSLFEMSNRYAVPPSEVLGRTLGMNLCPMARLSLSYSTKLRAPYGAPNFSVAISHAGDTDLVEATLGLEYALSRSRDVLVQWLLRRGSSSDRIQLHSRLFGVAVYNDVVEGRLFVLLAQIDHVLAARLERGLFRPLLPLLA